MDVHIVVKGDTLWKIARQYGISFEELKRVNAHLANPDYIVPGMKIFLPAAHRKQQHPVKQTPTHDRKTEHVQPIPVKHEQPKVEQKHEQRKEHKQEHKQEKKPAPKPPVQKPIQMPPPIKHAPPVQPAPVAPAPPPVPIPPTQPKKQPAPVPPVAPEMPVAPAPPAPVPTPAPAPILQFFQPLYSVPCGWMPIFDVDCPPFGHHHHHHHHGAHVPAIPPLPAMPSMPTPPVLPQGVSEAYEESSMKLESSSSHAPTMNMDLFESTELMYEESTSDDLQPPCSRHEQYYPPQVPTIQYQQQQPWSSPQFYPMPYVHWGCHIPCPMPMPMPMPYGHHYPMMAPYYGDGMSAGFEHPDHHFTTPPYS